MEQTDGSNLLFLQVKQVLGMFVSTSPTDRSTNTYSFASVAATQTFELNAVLEETDNATKDGNRWW